MEGRCFLRSHTHLLHPIAVASSNAEVLVHQLQRLACYDLTHELLVNSKIGPVVRGGLALGVPSGLGVTCFAIYSKLVPKKASSHHAGVCLALPSCMSWMQLPCCP